MRLLPYATAAVLVLGSFWKLFPGIARAEMLQEGQRAPANALPILGLDRRITYVIDEQGRIQKVFPEVDPSQHANEILAAVGAEKLAADRAAKAEADKAAADKAADEEKPAKKVSHKSE